MEPVQESSLLEMHVDYDGGNILRDTVKWTRFLSIIGFVGVGFLLLVMLFVGIAWDSISAVYAEHASDAQDYRVWVILILLGITGLFGFLVYMLFRFSTLTRRGLDIRDQGMFQKGLVALRIYFTCTGILALLGVGLYIYSLVNLI